MHKNNASGDVVISFPKGLSCIDQPTEMTAQDLYLISSLKICRAAAQDNILRGTVAIEPEWQP